MMVNNVSARITRVSRPSVLRTWRASRSWPPATRKARKSHWFTWSLGLAVRICERLKIFRKCLVYGIMSVLFIFSYFKI